MGAKESAIKGCKIIDKGSKMRTRRELVQLPLQFLEKKGFSEDAYEAAKEEFVKVKMYFIKREGKSIYEFKKLKKGKNRHRAFRNRASYKFASMGCFHLGNRDFLLMFYDYSNVYIPSLVLPEFEETKRREAKGSEKISSRLKALDNSLMRII